MQSTCGAHSRSTGQPCLNISGKGTDHIGQGKCGQHGGLTPTKHGLYSKVLRTSLRQRMAEIENDPNLVRLHSELALMKTLLESSAERFQSHDEALRAWHRAESSAYQTLIQTNDAAEIRDALVRLRAAEPRRPAELPDMAIITALVERIGRTSERVLEAETACTHDQLQQILDRMAMVVRQFVDEDTAQKIREGWLNLPREGR